MNKGGAKRDHYLSQMVTHAIADDANEEECSEAKDLFDIPVISVSRKHSYHWKEERSG